MRIPSRSDSSRRSAMPSIRLSLTSSAIFSSRLALLTWYGSSVTTIAVRSPRDLLERDLGAHDDPAAAVGVHLADGVDRLPLAGQRVALLLEAEDRAAGREVRALDVLAQVVGGQLGVVDQGDRRVDDLAQVVRRDVGGHADGDAGRAVDEQVRQLGRQDRRLLLACRRSCRRSRRCPCRCRPASRRRSRSGAPPCSASRPAGRRRPSRSCPGRRRAGSASRSPGRGGRGRRTGRRRRAGGTCPSPRRRSPRTCGTSWWPSRPISPIA